MTVASLTTLTSAAEMAGLSEDDLRLDYSGRGMYGDTCPAVVCTLSEFALFCAALGSFADEWDGLLARVRSDGMGLSTVWYFPGVTVEEV